MNSSSRCLRPLRGLIVVAITVTLAAPAGAQQQNDKQGRRYDPKQLRGVQLYLRTATRGPAGATRLPLLSPQDPGSATTRRATTPKTAPALPPPAPAADQPRPATASAALAPRNVMPAQGPKLWISSNRSSDRESRAAAPSGGDRRTEKTTSIVLSMGGRQSSSGAVATLVHWRRGASGSFSTPVHRSPVPSAGPTTPVSALRQAVPQPNSGFVQRAQESRALAPGAEAPALVISTRDSSDAEWTAATDSMATTALAPSHESAAPVGARRATAPVTSTGGYRLGAGDSIDVFVWRNPELSRKVPVRPDGRISLPLAGELVAAGKTAGELQDEITQILATYIQVPTVTVTVSEIKSLVVYVLGNVATSGPLELDRNVDVLQAIAMAGGPNEFADKNGVTIIRTVNGQQVRIAYPYGDVVKGKVQAPHLVLHAGDVIYVP